MPSNSRILNTIFRPYRTEQAITRAVFADYIPLKPNTNINAVHPIPVDWLQNELFPRERDDVKHHVDSLLLNREGLPAEFVSALKKNLKNLEAVEGATGAQPNNAGVRSSRVRFSDVDDITRGVGNMNTGNSVRRFHTVHSPSRPPGILRNNTRSTPHPTNDRQPSPNRDALVAVEVHLIDVESEIDHALHAPGVLDAAHKSIAFARSYIARARYFNPLTHDDVEVARGMVASVIAVANPRASTRPRPSIRRRPQASPPDSREPSPAPRGRRGRRNNHSAPADRSDPIRCAKRRGVEQEMHRVCAYEHLLIPLFRDEPVFPVVGDGLLLPDDGVSFGTKWTMASVSHHVRSVGSYLPARGRTRLKLKDSGKDESWDGLVNVNCR